MSEGGGYWLPHTSSIDFCEPDYVLSNYIAEPFNVISSLFIVILGLCGILHSNVTEESMFLVLFSLIIAVGFGSVLLHATLKAFPQSLDEVPMMWFNVCCYYIILNLKSTKIARNSWNIDPIGWFFLGLAVLETYVYYCMQWLYAMFLFVYLSTLLGVSYWCIKYILQKDPTHPEHVKLAKELYIAAVVGFYIIGGISWIIDMNLCQQLLPFYNSVYGVTLHIIWHVTAGYGAYFSVLMLMVARAAELGIAVERSWAWVVIPTIVRSQKKD